MVFARATDYPDYYPELPGGKIGRGIEVKPLNAKVIGDWWKTVNVPAAMPVKTDDVWLLGRAWSTPSGFVRGAQLVFRVAGGLVRGQKLVGIGAGLATSFLRAVVLDGRVPLWLNAPLEELLVTDGRITGVRVTRDGKPVTIGATRGVMLAGGGFDHNTDWRRKHHGIEGAPSGNPGNRGRPIEIAQQAGAAVDLMDDAWWGASVAAAPGHQPAFIVGERSLPYSIIVDARGDRFANESESYVDLGHQSGHRRPRHQGWCGHRRRRPRAAGGRHGDRGAVRGRQQLRLGDGPHLSRAGLDDRPGGGLRPARGPAPGWRQPSSTGSVMVEAREPSWKISKRQGRPAVATANGSSVPMLRA